MAPQMRYSCRRRGLDPRCETRLGGRDAWAFSITNTEAARRWSVTPAPSTSGPSPLTLRRRHVAFSGLRRQGPAMITPQIAPENGDSIKECLNFGGQTRFGLNLGKGTTGPNRPK